MDIINFIFIEDYTLNLVIIACNLIYLMYFLIKNQCFGLKVI